MLDAKKKNGGRELQKEEEYFMSIVFRAGNPNFPANKDELNKRLNEIEQLINKFNANIPFCNRRLNLLKIAI